MFAEYQLLLPVTTWVQVSGLLLAFLVAGAIVSRGAPSASQKFLWVSGLVLGLS